MVGLSINNEMIRKKIEINEFMVTMEFDYAECFTPEEFVLVPDASICIHVPPPRPKQMIFFKLKKSGKVSFIYQPILIERVLEKTPSVKDEYNSIYEVYAESLKDIDMEYL